MSRQKMKSEDFSVDDKRILFTVKDRSVITKACLHAPSWEGTRRDYSIRFTYYREAASGTQIHWGVYVNKKWKEGCSGTVFDAMQCVESAVENKELNKKLEALQA